MAFECKTTSTARKCHTVRRCLCLLHEYSIVVGWTSLALDSIGPFVGFAKDAGASASKGSPAIEKKEFQWAVTDIPVQSLANSDRLLGMESPSQSTRDLARRLLASSLIVSNQDVQAPVLVSDKLRNSLIKFAGVDAFTSLQRRALVLARAEVLSLQLVTMGVDGSLQGFDKVPADSLEDAGAAITANLLQLLVTFIGEPLMRMIIREAWPDTSLDQSQSTTERDR